MRRWLAFARSKRQRPFLPCASTRRWWRATRATHYGNLNDGPLLPAPGDLPPETHHVEASKTEPDKNTYLVLNGQTGADPNYDYGTHFLYQGHEVGAPGSLTRINLDADGAHRVTLLATKDIDGNPL